MALHLLAGGGRAAFATVMVNQPPPEVEAAMARLVKELGEAEEAASPWN